MNKYLDKFINPITANPITVGVNLISVIKSYSKNNKIHINDVVVQTIINDYNEPVIVIHSGWK